MSRADKSMFYGLTNLLASVDEGEEAGLARAPKTWWRRGGADLVSQLLLVLVGKIVKITGTVGLKKSEWVTFI